MTTLEIHKFAVADFNKLDSQSKEQLANLVIDSSDSVRGEFPGANFSSSPYRNSLKGVTEEIHDTLLMREGNVITLLAIKFKTKSKFR